MSSEDDHACPICLGPLCEAPGMSDSSNDNNGGFDYKIAATAPCGHLFHHSCIAEWQKAQPRGKCPTCNLPFQTCVKLFVDPSIFGGGDIMGDDDISLSSIEEEIDESEEEKEINTEMVDKADTAAETETQDNIDEEIRTPPLDSPNSLLNSAVVDLTSSPQEDSRRISASPDEIADVRRNLSLSTSKSRNSTALTAKVGKSSKALIVNAKADDQEVVHRLARIAKKFKRQYLQRNKQFENQCEENKKTAQKVNDLKKEIIVLKDEKDEMQTERHRIELGLNSSRYQIGVLTQERDESQKKCYQLEQETAAVSSRFKQLQEAYADAVEQKRKNSMFEVRQIIEENRKLKQRLEKKQSSRNGNVSRALNGGKISSKNAKNVTQSIRDFDQQVRNAFPIKQPLSAGHGISNGTKWLQAEADTGMAVKKKASGDLQKIDSTRYSSSAARMMIASYNRKEKRSAQSALVRATIGAARPAIPSNTQERAKDSTKRSLSLEKPSLQLCHNKRLKTTITARKGMFKRANSLS